MVTSGSDLDSSFFVRSDLVFLIIIHMVFAEFFLARSGFVIIHMLHKKHGFFRFDPGRSFFSV